MSYATEFSQRIDRLTEIFQIPLSDRTSEQMQESNAIVRGLKAEGVTVRIGDRKTDGFCDMEIRDPGLVCVRQVK